MSFTSPVDIANRALQHCGATRIDVALGFAENSKNASECAFCYDKLRQAELRRNVWRFAIREACLRAMDVNTLLLSASMWSSVTTYFVGSIVSDETGQLWISRIPDNLGYQPENSLTWEQYFGPLTVARYDSTTSYMAGELVYTTAGDGTNRVYRSLQSSNSDTPSTATAWAATTTYFKNQVVTESAVAYMSLVDLNLNQQPSLTPAAWTTTFVGGTGSLKWLQIGGAEFPMGVTVVTPNVVYPLGSGPSTQTATRNVYMLPSGFLREAPQDPKVSTPYDDWRFESDFIVTDRVDPIVFRFVTDSVNVTKMDPMFCEGLAARIGFEICEIVTQSSDKLKTIAGLYQKAITDARAINGIETGPTEPPEDDFISCRA